MKDKADHCYTEKSSNLHKNHIKHLPVHDSKKNLSFTKKSRHNDPPPAQKCQSVSMGKSVSSVLPANFASNTDSEAMPHNIANPSSCLYSTSQKGPNHHTPSSVGNIFSFFSADCQNKNSKKVPTEDLKKGEEQRSHSSLSHAWRWGKMSVAQNKNNADKKCKISHQVCNDLYPLKKHDKGQGSAQLNHSKWDKYASMKGGQKFQESQSINLTVLEDHQRPTPEQSLHDDKGMNIGIEHPESIKSHEGKTEYTGEMHNQLQENNYTSETGNSSTDSYLTYAENTLTSNREYEVNSEGFDTQDHTLDSGVHEKIHIFKHAMRKQYAKLEEDKCVCHHVACESIPSDKMVGEENFHQSKLQDTLLSEKANVDEGPIKAHKLIYSATEITNKNCIGKREDATKEVKGNSSIKETVDDQIYLSHAICRTDKVLRDCFNKECLCFLGENEPVSLDKHFCRDSKESDASGAAFLDEEQSWICNQEMGTDINVHDFNQMHTCQLEKEFSNVPGVWMEVCDIPHILDFKRSASGLNLIFEEGCALTEAYLMETENIATSVMEKGIIPDHKRESEELSATAEFCRPTALPEAHKWDEQNAVMLITTISIPSGNLEHEERGCSQPEETHVSEKSSSCHENGMQEIFKQMIEEKCEDIFLQDLEFESEIEIPLVQHEESLSVPQNPHSHKGGSDEEVDSLYQYLTDRIDWESLFGNTSQKILEKSEDHCSSGKKSCTKEDKTESLSTTVWPDLQITITNILKSGFSPPNIGIARGMWRCAIESPGLEVNMELSGEQRSEEYMQNLDLTNTMETCLPICVHEADSHMPEKESKTFTAAVTVSDVLNKGSSFYCTKPKYNSNEFKSKKGVQSKVKRKHPHNKSLTNTMRPQKASTCSPIYRNSKLCSKKREHYSSEMFSLLFEGRMKTLAQSEKHIKNVLNTLCSEASLCKSKRLSKKIDDAMFHLRKAQRRVLKSLKIVTKVGEKRQKGPLPKCYEIICNDLWESCDLEGHSFLTTGKYSAHFSQKRKCNIKENKRTVEFKKASDTVRCIPIKQRFKNKGDKMREMVSEEDMDARLTTGCAPVVLKDIISQIHQCKSDVTVASSVTCSQFSAATCKAYLAFEGDNVGDTRRITKLQTVSENSVGLDTIGLEDMELTNKEHKVFVNVSSKIHIQGTSGKCGSVTREDHISDANTFTNKNISKPLSLPVERDDSVEFCTDKRKDGACKTNVKMNAVIHTSLLKTAAESCLNANTNKQDVSTLSATHKNLDSILSTEKETMFSAGSEGISTNQSVGIGNFSTGSMRQMPATGGKHENSVPQVPLDHAIISAKAASLKMSSNISSERILETHSFETPTVPLSGQLQDRGYDRKETSNSEMRCLSNYSKVAEKETHVTETIKLEPLAKILCKRENNIEIENYLKNVSSVSLVYNALTPFSNQYISQEVGQNTFPKIKETGLVESKVKSPVNQYVVKDVPGRSSAKVVLAQRSITHREGHSRCNKECIQSSSNSSAFTAPVLRKPIDKKFAKRNEDWEESTNKDRQINSELKSGIMAKQGVRNNLSGDHPNKRKGLNSKNKHRAVGTELKSLAFITEISNILQKADETSSLKILQEQITVCDNFLPSFVKAFEEKQGCSLKHILVSRELLVEKKLWTNCKSKLKSHAVDSLVELQMIMETIQFIENKKCFLEREPTFRSLLWYDDSLYGELLGRPSGYQQQSNFFPAFQRRLKYNVFRELQSYRRQLLELFEKTRWENKSYYAFLKFRREIDECEAVIQHNSDCLDFFLSVPFTCGVNFGDTLEDLETVRKSAVELINTYKNLPDAHSYAEKEDHLWVIMEIISTKISFIKACESINMKASLFGLEHIFFDAAKSLVWKDRRLLLNKASPNKKKQLLCKINQDALSRLYEVYEYVDEEFRTEKSNNITEKKNDTEKSKYCENKGKHGDENSDFLHVLLSHPDICCVGEILDEAQFADLKKLQQLMLRCTEHLESLKMYFQILQEEDVNKILITEQNVLDTMKNDGINAVILKPEAVETYIEVLMMYETIHFLKNSIARKIDEQRFRSLLWFDLSLLPELAHCQKKMSSFSFLKDNSMDNLCKTVESAISDLKSELDIVWNYAETINCSYALHLLTRELSELSETRKLIQNSKPSIFTYVECVPYTISVNYGSTVTELDYNYNQFSLLLENLMLAARKDLGKMAHIMKIMKTIEHMKFACAKKGKSVLSLLIYQMLNNWRKTCQLKRKGDRKTHLTKTKKSVCETQAPVCVIKTSSQPQKKRPSFVSSHGDTPECTESSPPSSCKKQKVRSFLITSKCFVFKRELVNPENEKDLASSISLDNLGNKRPLEKTVQDQLPCSPLHSKDLEAVYCSSHVKCTSDASKSSFVNLKGLTSQQSSANLKRMIKRNSNFYKSARKHHEGFAPCDKKCENAHLSLEKEPLLQKSLENDLCSTQKSVGSTTKLSDRNMSRSSLLAEYSTTNNLATKPDRKEKKHEKNSESPSSVPVSTSDLPVIMANKNTESPSVCSLLEPHSNEKAKSPTEHSALFQNELPPSAPPVQGSLVQAYETSYPYYSFYSCHQSDSNGSSITQTYQGITYEVQQFAHSGTSAVASNVYNAHSNMFYSQSFSYAALGELQRPNYAQTYPVHGYFSSQMPLPYSSQMPSLPQYAANQPWSQGPFPYPSNTGSSSEAVWTSSKCMATKFSIFFIFLEQ
uniref:Testis expressed 15, meiosis and synapsis associated n=1 Tax=Chelydra serpentina TaxID=8475 RepID=A0A8C3XW44_CHESE